MRSESTILKPETIANTKGWYIQQLLKLGVAKIIATQYYLMLDADRFLTRSFTYEDLFHDGKLLTNTESWTVHKDWWLSSLDILAMSVDQMSNNPVIAVTPQILKTVIFLELLDFIDHTSGQAGWEAYLSGRKFTEYSLYWLFLIRNNLTHLYHCVASPALLGNAFWDLHHRQNGDYYFSLVQSNINGISVEWLSALLQNYLRPNESAYCSDAGESR